MATESAEPSRARPRRPKARCSASPASARLAQLARAKTKAPRSTMSSPALRPSTEITPAAIPPRAARAGDRWRAPRPASSPRTAAARAGRGWRGRRRAARRARAPGPARRAATSRGTGRRRRPARRGPSPPCGHCPSAPRRRAHRVRSGMRCLDARPPRARLELPEASRPMPRPSRPPVRRRRQQDQEHGQRPPARRPGQPQPVAGAAQRRQVQTQMSPP